MYADNIELCTPNTQFMGVYENIFERNEGNSINNLQISDERNILAPVELSQIATPLKNLKVSQKYPKPGSFEFNESEDRRQEVFEMMKSINESRKERNERKNDDFEAFGDIVARKVRGLRTHYAQCTIQHLINNLLYDGELGKHDVPPQTFQVHTNYNNNYIDGSAASTSSNQTLAESLAINYHDESSYAIKIPYSNPPSITDMTETTPELWETH